MERLIYQGSIDEETRVRRSLSKATDAIVETIGSRGLGAVVLAGGFGKGEGALLRADGSDSKPFNDFDFLVVGTRRNVPGRVLGELRSMLPRILNVDFVDINYMRSSQLMKVSPTVFFYELKHGNKILWGTADALKGLPSFEASGLPLTEATRLFLNRGLGLLSVLLQLGDSQSPQAVVRRAAVAWSKVVLAAGDCFLLERKLYHWSYVERMRRLREVVHHSILEDGFESTYVRAGTFKLTADFSILPSQDAGALCTEAQRIHERYFRVLERKRTFAELADWKSYPAVVLRTGLQPVRRRLKHFFLEGRDVETRLRSLPRFLRLPLWDEERRLAILPLILYAASKRGYRKSKRDYVAEACSIQYGRRGSEESDWRRLAVELVGDSHP